MEPFNPNSPHAMFARIDEKLDRQDEQFAEFREEFRAHFMATNGRLTSLEREAWRNRGIAATIALGASFVWQWITSRSSVS